jgi:hypothetical protein
MVFKRPIRQITIIIVLSLSLAGCQLVQSEAKATVAPTPIPTHTPPATAEQRLPTPGLASYAFPNEIDPAKSYLFYLHGKIIEDQGVPAISPAYGEYEYGAILQRLAGYGFVVISEARSKNTDDMAYARKISGQARALLEAGVPAGNITIVGASKGAAIAVFASHFINNKDMNFVIMAICNPDMLQAFEQNQMSLAGNVLSIYDSVDEFAGSCQDLFSFSEGKGISRHDEIVLHIGTGHGILYQPLDEWVLPTVGWAGK